MAVRKSSEKVIIIIEEQNKMWDTTRKMANSIISLAKEKYRKENVNAIVAVEKDNMVVLRKDVFESAEAMLDEVVKWTKGKYNVYYTTKKE